MGHGHNRHAYCVKTRNDLIGNRIVSTCRNDTIRKTQYALLCHFGAYCVISRFPCLGERQNNSDRARRGHCSRRWSYFDRDLLCTPSNSDRARRGHCSRHCLHLRRVTSFASDLGPPANALGLRETRLNKTPAFLDLEREASRFLQGVVELLYKLLRLCECSGEGELRWECELQRELHQEHDFLASFDRSDRIPSWNKFMRWYAPAELFGETSQLKRGWFRITHPPKLLAIHSFTQGVRRTVSKATLARMLPNAKVKRRLFWHNSAFFSNCFPFLRHYGL